MTGPSRAGAVMASDQWAVLASGACSYSALALPPPIEFDEDKVRNNYERSEYKGPTGQKKLDGVVAHWTGIPQYNTELRALPRPDKIKRIIDARRVQHEAQIENISRAAAPLFEALVECQMSAAEFDGLQNCVASIGHGSSIATTSHAGFLDEELVDESIRVFKAAKADGLIKNAQDFYSGGTGKRGSKDQNVGIRFTESLISEDSPFSKVGSAGRISLWRGQDLYARDLSKTKVVLGFVVDGGVKDVEDAEMRAGGRLVVALQRRGELYHFLIRRGQFLLANEVTPACAVKIMRIVVPLLYLTYQQDTTLVPRVKKEALGDDGLEVGLQDNSGMIAGLKNVVPKMVARGVSTG